VTTKYCARLGLIGFFIAAGFGACWAAVVAFLPVKVHLSATQPYSLITVRNQSAVPVTFETSLFRWQQRSGVDALIPSEDLVVSPPIFVVQAGKAQVVRIRLLDAPDAEAETHFRIIFNELSSTTRNKSGHLVAMTVSLPVFVAPISKVSANVETAVARSGQILTLTVANQGNVHAQLGRVYREKDGERDPNPVSMLGYVLPGNKREFTFEQPDYVIADALVAIFADGQEIRVPVPPPRQ